jgi:hypothetical protein
MSGLVIASSGLPAALTPRKNSTMPPMSMIAAPTEVPDVQAGPGWCRCRSVRRSRPGRGPGRPARWRRRPRSPRPGSRSARFR